MFKIKLKDQDFPVTEVAINKLLNIIAHETTERLDILRGPATALANSMALKKLYGLEKEAYEKGATKEEAKSFRPDKGQDPAIKLLLIMLGGLKEALQYVELRFKCNDNGEIADFSYEFKDTSKTG